MRLSNIEKNAEILGSDGVLAGVVDHVDGDRIELVQPAGEPDKPRKLHRFVPTMFVARIEDGKVILTVRAEAAVMFEEHGKAPSWQRRIGASRTDRRM